MERDSLERELQAKLGDFESPGDVPAWAEMRRRMVLHANANPPEKPLRRFGGWKGYAAAAAVLLAAALGVWQLRPDDSVLLPRSEEASIPPFRASVPERPTEVPALKNPVLNELFKSAKKVGSGVAGDGLLAAASLSAPSGPGASESVGRPENRPSDPLPADEPSSDRSAQAAEASGPSRATIEAYRKKFEESAPSRARSRYGWTTSLFANASTFSRPGVAVPSPSVSGMTTLHSGLLDVSRLQNLPDIDKRQLDHRFPVSVGLSVRKYIAPRLGVETGLTYTYLRSTADMDRLFAYEYDQRLHYLGIPLSLTYSVLDSKRFDLYFSGGVLAEFPVSARATTRIFSGPAMTSSVTEKLPSGGMLWSVNLGTGFGVNVVDRFGLYVEPGVNYYFRNKNQPASYRTENPWNVNLKVGFRYSF